MTIIPWPSDKVESIWGDASSLLEKAVSLNGGYLIEDVLFAIRTQKMQLFIVADDDNEIVGAIVTEILIYPRQKVFFVLFLGGSRFASWPMDKLWRWGEMMGCNKATGIGRRGWDKLYPEAKTNAKFYSIPLGEHNE